MLSSQKETIFIHISIQVYHGLIYWGRGVELDAREFRAVFPQKIA